MTDDELLIKSLKSYLKDVDSEYQYAKQFTDADSAEIAEDNLEIRDILTPMLEDITGIESLNDLDDEDYAFVYECLQAYAESFIIDGRNKEIKKASEEEYNQLMEIISEMEADFMYDEDEDE